MPRRQQFLLQPLPQPKTLWDKIWHDAWTKSLGVAQAIGAGILAIIPEIGRVVHDPNFQDALKSVELPGAVLLGLAILGAITYVSAEQ